MGNTKTDQEHSLSDTSVEANGEFIKTPIPKTLPILPLRGTVIYPTMVIPLLVARERSIRMINEVLDGNQMIGLVAQKNPEEEEPDTKDIYRIGIVAQIIKMIKITHQGILREYDFIYYYKEIDRIARKYHEK